MLMFLFFCFFRHCFSQTLPRFRTRSNNNNLINLKIIFEVYIIRCQEESSKEDERRNLSHNVWSLEEVIVGTFKA